MRYLIDSDIASYYLRGKYNLQDKFIEKGIDTIRLSSVTLAEMRVVAHRNPESKLNFHSIREMARKHGVLNPDENTWAIYSKIKADLLDRVDAGGVKKSGDLDILQASIAKQYNLVVVTNNTKHFEDIYDKVENWKN